jgi:cytochrome P450
MAFPRFAREDVVVAGERIPKGGLVLCSLSAANRDHPDAPTGAPTADATGPESGGPTRRPAPHLAFGYGIHRCVGAELARMELRAAYPALVRRFPHMRLAVDPSELAFRQLSIVYGLDALPVQPGPAAGHWGRVGVGTAGAGETCPV